MCIFFYKKCNIELVATPDQQRNWPTNTWTSRPGQTTSPRGTIFWVTMTLAPMFWSTTMLSLTGSVGSIELLAENLTHSVSKWRLSHPDIDSHINYPLRGHCFSSRVARVGGYFLLYRGKGSGVKWGLKAVWVPNKCPSSYQRWSIPKLWVQYQ